MKVKISKKEGMGIFLEEGEIFAPSLIFSLFMKFFRKKTFCACKKLTDCVFDGKFLEDFLVTIKKNNIKGIYYDRDEMLLSVSEDLSEVKFRDLIYALRLERYFSGRPRYLENILIELFEKTHQEYFLKKSHFSPRRHNFYRIYCLEGADAFESYYLQGYESHFWLEWKATFELRDEKKVLEHPYWHQPYSYHEDIINSYIKQTMAKYIFEVGGKNSCSYIYASKEMSNKEIEFLPDPKYPPDLWYILQEAKEILKPSYMNFYGAELKYLTYKQYRLLTKPCLGLWELTEKERTGAYKKLDEAVYSPIFSKIRKAQLSVSENKKKEVETIEKGFSEINKEAELKNQEITLFFSDKEINIEGVSEEIKKEIITSFKKTKRIYPLLKFWLEFHSQLHWLYGFIIFDNWRKKKIQNPIGAFSQSMSYLSDLGIKTKLWMIETSAEKGDRYKKGHWKLEGIRFSSNISEAQKFYNKAKESKDASEKKMKLIKACEIYPDYLEACLLLIECWGKENFKDINPKEIEKMKRFITAKEISYSEACIKIRQLKGPCWRHKETYKVSDEIHDQLQRIEHSLRILKEQKIFSSEEEECEKIKDLIKKVGEENSADKSYLLLLKEPLIMKAVGSAMHYLCPEKNIPPDQEVDLFNVLKVAAHIDSTDKIDEGFKATRRIVSDIYSVFLNLIIKGELNIDNLKAGDPEGFKNKLIETLLREIRKEKGEERPPKECHIRDDYSKEYQQSRRKNIEDSSS